MSLMAEMSWLAPTVGTCWESGPCQMPTSPVSFLHTTGFLCLFTVSSLLHLPPVRFHCVGGCWDRTQNCCDFGIGIGFTIVHGLMQTKNIGTRVSFETIFCTIRNKTFVSVLYRHREFWCFDWTEQTEVNQNSLINSIFLYFFQKSYGRFGLFRFVSVCFETVCFGCFASTPKQRVSMFRLNRNKK